MLLWLAQQRSADGIAAFRLITLAGSNWAFVLALLIFPGWHFYRRDPKRAATLLVGMGLLMLSIAVWKRLVGRPRPEVAIELVRTYAMPSGHTAKAVILFGLSAMAGWRLKAPVARWAVLSACLLAIALVGFSRMYLGVHFPTDVILSATYTGAGIAMLDQPRLRRIFAARTMSSSGSSPRSHF